MTLGDKLAGAVDAYLANRLNRGQLQAALHEFRVERAAQPPAVQHAPVNTVKPVITGAPHPHSTLSVSTGTWT